jgi:hypothetical protein
MVHPWRQRFAHDHWWKEPAQVATPLEAAFWEIFRRNPKIGELLKQLPQVVFERWDDDLLVAGLSLESWPQLGNAGRKFWRYFLIERMPPQRGLHADAVILVNQHRKKLWRMQRHSKEDPGKMREYARALAIWGISKEWIDDAVQCDRDGRVLIAVDPLATGIGKLVEQIVKDWRRDFIPKQKGKQRLDQWLDVIACFEKAELDRHRGVNRDDQLFVRYRRIIDRLKLPF